MKQETHENRLNALTSTLSVLQASQICERMWYKNVVFIVCMKQTIECSTKQRWILLRNQITLRRMFFALAVDIKVKVEEDREPVMRKYLQNPAVQSIFDTQNENFSTLY